MKKSTRSLLLAGLALLAGFHSAWAQRGTIKTFSTSRLENVTEHISQTESYSLDAGYEMLVVPLVAEVKVLGTEQRIFTGSSREHIPAGLADNEYLIHISDMPYLDTALKSLKAAVIYDFSAETNSQIIVMPQFNIQQKTRTIKKSDASGQPIEVHEPVIYANDYYVMEVEAKGFPAIYTGFRTGTEADRWIKETYMEGKQEQTNSNIKMQYTKSSETK